MLETEKAVQLTDEEFTEQLLNWQRYIWKMAFKYGYRNSWDFDDYVSDCNLRAWQYREFYDGNRGAFSTWLNKICLSAHIYIKNWRSRQKRIPSSKLRCLYNRKDEFVDIEDKRPVFVDFIEAINELKPMIDKLRPTQKDAIYGFLQGKTLQEIADDRGVSRQAVHISHHNAIKNIKVLTQVD